MRFFFLLFLLVPILEIVLLIQIGGEIGALATIAWLALAAVIGIALIRFQGVATLIRAREQMAQGKMPGQALADGLVLAFAGVLFIIPGFATDVVATLCLIPSLRHLLIGRWVSRLRSRAGGNRGNVYDVEADVVPRKHERVEQKGQVFEGEVETKVERKDP